MGRRSAEHVVRTSRHGPEIRFRVDLHGVSSFGPGDDERTLIRWEWVETIAAADGADEGVDVTSARASVHLPAGTFGLPPDQLGALLREGLGIERRPDVITTLAGHCP